MKQIEKNMRMHVGSEPRSSKKKILINLGGQQRAFSFPLSNWSQNFIYLEVSNFNTFFLSSKVSALEAAVSRDCIGLPFCWPSGVKGLYIFWEVVGTYSPVVIIYSGNDKD